MKVLTNRYQRRDSAGYHENISSFPKFDIDDVADILANMASEWDDDRESGWKNRPLVDWFFGGKTNLGDVSRNIADDIRVLCGCEIKIKR